MSVEGKKVLLVDDSDDNRYIINELLSEMHLQVCSARDGPEALSMVPEFQPDLVLLDVMMPRMNGLEVLEKLNVHSNPYEVIMITGHENIDDACRAMELGAFSYIRKPIQFEQVIEQVTKALVKVDETINRLQKELAYKETLKKYSDQLKETFDLAEFQSKRFDLILNNMSEPFIAIDNDTNVMMLNHAAEEAFNLTVGMSLGCKVDELFRDKAFVQSIVKLIRNANKTDDTSIFKVVSFREFFFNASISKLINVAGTATGYMIIFNDITDSLRAEHIRKTFLHLVSREIKTPLSIITNSNTSLALDNNISDESRLLLSDIDGACRQLYRLANNITRFTRTLSTITQLQLKTIDVVGFMETLVNEHHQRASEKNITVKFQKEVAECTLITDQDLLSTALECVLDNALKYSPSGEEVVVKLSDCAEDSKNVVTIEVIDNGPGIDQPQLDSIFEWFRQGNDPITQNYGGIGLGLPLAQKALMLLGGEIEISSGSHTGFHCIIGIPKRIADSTPSTHS